MVEPPGKVLCAELLRGDVTGILPLIPCRTVPEIWLGAVETVGLGGGDEGTGDFGGVVVMGADDDEAELEPAAFVAVVVKVYAWPGVRPVMVQVPLAPETVQVRLPGEAVTV